MSGESISIKVMNAHSSLLPAIGTVIAILFYLGPSILRAEEGVPANDLGTLASGKLPALIRIPFIESAGEDRDKAEGLPTSEYCGFFVTKDGAALCNLESFSQPRIPDSIRTMEDQEIHLEAVWAVFPEHQMALVKFRHKPKVWMELDAAVQPLGTPVAAMDLPPSSAVVGPILARYQVYQEGRFEERLSLGAGLHGVVSPTPFGRAPVLDSRGQVVALFSGARPQKNQTHLLCISVETLAPAVQEALKERQILPFPLPQKDQPPDPARFSLVYGELTANAAQGDFAGALRNAKQLKTLFPDSDLAKGLELDMTMALGLWDDALALLPALELKAKGNTAQKAFFQSKRAQIRAGNGNLPGAIEAMEEAVALSPKDYVTNRISLAVLYRAAGRWDDAERLFRAASMVALDSIDTWEGLQSVLERKGNWEEADRITETVMRLERLYRRQ